MYRVIPFSDPLGPFPPGTQRCIENGIWTYKVKDLTRDFPEPMPSQNVEITKDRRSAHNAPRPTADNRAYDAADWCWSVYIHNVHFCALADKVAKMLSAGD